MAVVYELMEHVQDSAFLVFSLPIHAQSEKRRQVNPRKGSYAIDHGLVRACVGRRSEDLGHHLENLVYLETAAPRRSARVPPPRRPVARSISSPGQRGPSTWCRSARVSATRRAPRERKSARW
jgi:hypothetical protein